MAKFWTHLRHHEDKVPKRNMKEEDIQFLLGLQKELNTQDTCGNAEPRYWVIKGPRKIYRDTFFLTQKAAEDHLRKYSYNYDENATTFALTAWRSPEYEQLLRIIQQVDWKKGWGQ